MNYAIIERRLDTDYTKIGDRVIRFRPETSIKFANKAYKLKSKYAKPNVNVSAINDVPALEASKSKLDSVLERLEKLMMTLTDHANSAVKHKHRALRVKSTTLIGIYAAKRTKKKVLAVEPVISNVVEFPKRETPNIEINNVPSANIEMPKAKEVQTVVESLPKQPYGGVPIYSSASSPIVEKEVKAPTNVTPIISASVSHVSKVDYETSDNANALSIEEYEKSVMELAKEAEALENQLINKKLAYDRERADAQKQKIEQLKAQAAYLRKTIVDRQNEISEIEEERNRLKAA